MARTTKPAQRKIGRDHRYRMAVFVSDRLRAPGLRETEAAARQGVIDALYTAATAIPAAEIEVLRKHYLAQRVTSFTLPSDIAVSDGEERQVERPDGVKVDLKPKTHTLRSPRDGTAVWIVDRFCSVELMRVPPAPFSMTDEFVPMWVPDDPVEIGFAARPNEHLVGWAPRDALPEDRD